MAKERLDLMVDGKVKQLLKNVAAGEGISMSQLVEVMLMEHLSDEEAGTGPMHAVADILWIQDLQRRFQEAMSAGSIYSFRTYCDVAGRAGALDDEPTILYVGRDEGRFREGDIVLDFLIDEAHADIISTYDSVLRTVSVRMTWAEGDAGALEPYGLRVWPRGRTRLVEPLFDWECPVAWAGSRVSREPKYRLSWEPEPDERPSGRYHLSYGQPTGESE